jgi:ribose transport system ATP-binding protein
MSTVDVQALPGTPGGDAAAGDPEVALRVRGISKRYGPVQALAEMDLVVRRGEIHALVGENGSGKSTLVSIISGVSAPDTGTVEVGTRRLARYRPAASQAAGVLTVFQDGSMIPELTVAQNLYTGTPKRHRPRYSRIDAWTREILAEYELSLSPTIAVSALPAGDRQLLEIVRAVAASPDLLLLDEATSALDSAGVDRVLDLVRSVAASGTSVLFVTHRLSEVFRVAHRVTVLRDGVLQTTSAASDVDAKALVETMAGARVDMEFPERKPLAGDASLLLAAQGLAGPGFGPIDVELKAGQIVGIAGAGGNGQPQLLRALATLGATGGTVTLTGKELHGYRGAVSSGAILLSNDRRTESLFQSLSVRENIVASTLSKFARVGVMRPMRERKFVEERVDELGIRLASATQFPAELSGGNQQKVALSRVLATEPRVVLIDEPTQGVDVRSRLDIYRLLRSIADAGSAVVIVSSDASELAGLCDRILVISRGKVTGDMPGIGTTEEKIVHAFAVESVEREATSVDQVGDQPKGVSSRKRYRIHVGADAFRLFGLLMIIIGISVYANTKSSTFLSSASIYNVLLLALPMIVVAAAEFCVLLTGVIDVSIGSTMSLSVVVVSFWATSGSILTAVGGAIAAAVVVGVVVGAVNAWLVEGRGISPVIATIATLGVAAGVALVLRPTPAGSVSVALSDDLNKKIGVFPAPLIGVAVLIVIGDVLLRRTGIGLRVRAVGLNGVFAYRLGTNARLVRSLSYIACGVVAGFAGVLLAAQVGVGDPSTGSSYTLLAIAAPVLGGASLLGGRGFLIGPALGAVLLALAQSLVPVLGISDATSYLFTGGLTLIGLIVYSDLWRRGRRTTP